MVDRSISASCVLFSLAGVSSRFRETRSFFGLFSAIFGEHTAIPIILLYLVSAAFGVATIAAGIGQYLVFLGFQSVLPIEIAIIVLFCGINIIGISLSGKTENILTVLKTIPLLSSLFSCYHISGRRTLSSPQASQPLQSLQRSSSFTGRLPVLRSVRSL